MTRKPVEQNVETSIYWATVWRQQVLPYVRVSATVTSYATDLRHLPPGV